MKRSNLKIILAIAVLAVVYAAGTMGKASLRSKLRAAQNERALSDSLKVVWEDETYRLSERLAVVQESERDLQNIVETRVPAMAQRIADLEGTEHALIEATAVIDSITAEGAAIDTVFVGPDSTEVHQVSFHHRQPGISIDVVTRTPPPVYELKADFDPIPLDIGIFELPTGEIGVDVQAPSWVTLAALNTNIHIPGPTWLERYDFQIGLGLGVITVLAILLAAGG